MSNNVDTFTLWGESDQTFLIHSLFEETEQNAYTFTVFVAMQMSKHAITLAFVCENEHNADAFTCLASQLRPTLSQHRANRGREREYSCTFTLGKRLLRCRAKALEGNRGRLFTHMPANQTPPPPSLHAPTPPHSYPHWRGVWYY